MKLLCIYITFVLTVLCCVVCSGQMLTLNGYVTITNSTRITVKGNILLNLDANFSNTDTIDLTGDWINNDLPGNYGFIPPHTGTVIFNGINQSIGGFHVTTFHTVSLFNGIKTLDKNTAAGYPSGGVYLNLNNSVLDLNSKTFLLYSSTPSTITNTTGYILSEDADMSSRFVWEGPLNTPGVYTTPFGNAAGVQIPFVFKVITSSGSVSAATYVTATNNTPYPTAPIPVTHVRNTSGLDNSANTVDRFWYVSKAGGLPIEMTFCYAPSENAANGNTNVRAQRWNAFTQGWDAALPGQSNPTTQSVAIAASNFNSGNIWAFAQESSPLPVELLAFDAQPVNNKQVLCNWVTASEKNNDYFTIEHSANAVDFFAIGTVQGHGTTNEQYNYEFMDSNPLKGVSYYRLKQTDYNGEYSFSPVVPVFLNTDNTGFTLFPNPGSGGFYLSSSHIGEGTYSIVNLLGQEVHTGKFIMNGDLLYLDLLHLSEGLYHMYINTSAGRSNLKMQVRK